MRAPPPNHPQKAFHLMFLANEVRGGKTLRFYQNLVIYADSAEEAKARTTALFARHGAAVVEFDEEETYESDPARVGYEKGLPEDGVVGITGRIYILDDPEEMPRTSLLARVVSAVMFPLKRLRG